MMLTSIKAEASGRNCDGEGIGHGWRLTERKEGGRERRGLKSRVLATKLNPHLESDVQNKHQLGLLPIC